MKKTTRVMLLGATGTVGQAVVEALIAHGHEVVCFLRNRRGFKTEATVRVGNVTDLQSMRRDGFCGEAFDVVVSCLASRSGAPEDAWSIDHRAHSNALACAKEAGVKHMVLLSAICVQKPQLQFQFAKLAFEQELVDSGLIYSIVRPTALFKSLSGQIARVKAGKAFLVFGNGQLTRSKPISDTDLATYMVGCINDVSRHNRILPIGGPGPAITPFDQGQELFRLLGKPARFKHVPVALLDGIIGGLSALGSISSYCKGKAELARIGRYYATESMLVLNPETGQYDADLTPSFGQDRLWDFYKQQIASNAAVDLGAHKVF
jgi:divinyl chlorophyllide a 8-vinyl-reductase